MRYSAIASAVLFCVSTCTERSWGQPTVNRVEQSLREQLGAATDPSAKAEPGFLGLIADDRQEEGRGVRVMDVMPQGPAAKAGLKAGDLITGINSREIKTMDDMA